MKDGARIVLWSVAVVVLIAFLYIIGAYAIGGASQITAPFRGKTAEKNLTEADGAFRVTSYGRYFDLCASVQAKEGKIRNINKQLDRDGLSEVRRQQLEDAVLANENQRTELIAQYNGLTSNKFNSAYKDKGLPYNLDEADPRTECKI